MTPQEIEAIAELDYHRPVPEWVVFLAIIGGAALVSLAVLGGFWGLHAIGVV